MEGAVLRGRLSPAVKLGPGNLKLIAPGDWGWTSSVYSKPHGLFCADRFLPGSFQLVLNPEGPRGDSPYPRTVLKDNIVLDSEREIDLGTIRLPDALPVDTLEVRVRYPDGSPVAGARVTVDSYDGAIADANGIARLAMLHKSEHTVLAQYWVVYLGYWTRVWEAQATARGSIVEITIDRVEKPTFSKYMYVL